MSEPTLRYTHCTHMRDVLPRMAADQTIVKVCEVLSRYDFDTIAFRGISGTILAPIIAYKLRKEMILVRKNNGNNCASGRWVEGYAHARRYVVLDDLICSGESCVDTVFATMTLTRNLATCIGICLYDDTVQMVNEAEFNRIIHRAQKEFEFKRSLPWGY